MNALIMRFANLAMGIIVARILSPHDFGVFAVAWTVYTIVISASELGIGTAISRMPDGVDEVGPTATTLALSSSVGLAAGLFFVSPLIARTMGSSEATSSLQVLTITIALAGVSTIPVGLLTREFMQSRIFGAELANFVVANIILVVLALSGWGALALAVSRVAGQIVGTGILLYLSPKRYRPWFSVTAAKELLRFGVPLVGASFVGFFASNLDFMFVSRLLGSVKLGLYTLAFNISSWPFAVLGRIIHTVALPSFARAKGDRDALGEQMANVFRLVAAAAYPLSAMCAGLAYPLVTGLYGERWNGAAMALVALAMVAVVRLPLDVIASAILATGRSMTYFLTQLVQLIALPGALLLCVDRWGIVGAGIAQVLVVSVMTWPMFVTLMVRQLGVPVRVLTTAIAPPAVASAAAALSAWGITTQLSGPWLQLIAGGCAGGVVFVLILGRWLKRYVLSQVRRSKTPEVDPVVMVGDPW